MWQPPLKMSRRWALAAYWPCGCTSTLHRPNHPAALAREQAAAAATVGSGHNVLGSVLYCFSLNHKQMSLYYAPAFFAYLLAASLGGTTSAAKVRRGMATVQRWRNGHNEAEQAVMLGRDATLHVLGIRVHGYPIDVELRNLSFELRTLVRCCSGYRNRKVGNNCHWHLYGPLAAIFGQR